MSKPHTCPTCFGAKKLVGEPCKTCSETGVVWEPADVSEAAENGQDMLDLTYRVGDDR